MVAVGYNYCAAMTTVEDCLKLDINFMQRKKFVVAGASGKLTWSRYGEVFSSISYRVRKACYGDDLILVLTYTATIREEKFPIEEEICIIKTPAYFGNYRYWMSCPLCGNTVCKLYLPPGGKYFRCRKCYNLTYTSCNESHKWDRCYAYIGAITGLTLRQVKAGLKSGDIDPCEYL